jgi:acyl-CoA synthetase (NDP forming)
MPRDEAATIVAPVPAAEAAPAEEVRLSVVPARKELAERLLKPASVALIGAGTDPDEPQGRPLHLLRLHGFQGHIHPVNASRRVVQGVGAVQAVAALPAPVDQALILLEGDTAIDAVEACGRAGIPVAVLRSALAHDDPAIVRARRERLVDAARRHDLRILGPGSSGLVVPATGLSLTTEPAFAARKPGTGRFMVLSHGGSAMGALFSRAAARALGFAALVSVGQELDLSLGEIGTLAADDPEIDAFLLFLHGLDRTDALVRFAAKAHAADKPIIAYKLKRGPAARPDETVDGASEAFFAAHGIIRVDQFEALLELAPMMVRRRPARGRTAAVISTAECAGTLMADRLTSLGIAVDGLDGLARDRLAQQGVALGPARVADIAPKAMRAVLDEALDAPNNDVVLAVLGAGAEINAEEATAPVIAAAQRADKPLAALVVPEAPEALRSLAAAGVAAFRTPEAAADGLRAFLAWTPRTTPPILWEEEAPRAGHRVLHAGQAMQIFRLLGIPIPTMLWIKRESPLPKSLPFPPPYVLKVLSPDIEHRIEIGGMALGIETISAVAAAADDIAARVAETRPDAFLDGMMIQRLERGLAEVAIGFRRDPEAGPVVTLAMGEGMADIYGDRAVRLAPIDRMTAYAMIDEVKGLARLRGYRNRPRGDLDVLAHVLIAMSSFALITAPRVLEATVDPLLIRAQGQGAVALDGWMKTE